MVKLDPRPILVRGQRGVRASGARREANPDLARGEVEEFRGMVRKRCRGMRRGEQAKLDPVRGNSPDVLALILEQKDN